MLGAHTFSTKIWSCSRLEVNTEHSRIVSVHIIVFIRLQFLCMHFMNVGVSNYHLFSVLYKSIKRQWVLVVVVSDCMDWRSKNLLKYGPCFFFPSFTNLDYAEYILTPNADEAILLIIDPHVFCI